MRDCFVSEYGSASPTKVGDRRVHLLREALASRRYSALDEDCNIAVGQFVAKKLRIVEASVPPTETDTVDTNTESRIVVSPSPTREPSPTHWLCLSSRPTQHRGHTKPVASSYRA